MEVGPDRSGVDDPAPDIGRRRVDPSRPWLGSLHRAVGEADVENDQGHERLDPSHSVILRDVILV